ncbi:MAG TPA: hypothetical protein DHV36_10550 [Desulfobacteraceae bacterium]|nr:hypothetical protein [Desulfobacteraceae bacterium]
MMKDEPGMLATIRQQSPELWKALKNGESQGLIFLDEANDAVSATNRLLLTYPDLHEVVNQIVDQWTRTHAPDFRQALGLWTRHGETQQ